MPFLSDQQSKTQTFAVNYHRQAEASILGAMLGTCPSQYWETVHLHHKLMHKILQHAGHQVFNAQIFWSWTAKYSISYLAPQC